MSDYLLAIQGNRVVDPQDGIFIECGSYAELEATIAYYQRFPEPEAVRNVRSLATWLTVNATVLHSAISGGSGVGLLTWHNA